MALHGKELAENRSLLLNFADVPEPCNDGVPGEHFTRVVSIRTDAAYWSTHFFVWLG